MQTYFEMVLCCTKEDDKDGIAQIQFASCTNDTLIKKVKDFKDAYLVQSQDPLDQDEKSLFAPLEKWAALSKIMLEAVLKMTVLQEKGTLSTEKSFSKIPVSYRNMLLKWSSTSQAKFSILGEEEMDFFKISGIK